MNKRSRILAELAFTIGLLAPIASAQKPPAPPPPSGPAPSPPTRSATPLPSTAQPIQPDGDFVMFLMGRIATNDGSAIPHDLLVERICSEHVRQQVYASANGDFSMQMGSRTDSFLDASSDITSPERVNDKDLIRGIPQSELKQCDLQASASGFRSNRVNLLSLTPSSGSVDVGVIVVERTSKIKGMTLSALPYKAPPNARKAYEKGLDAENKGKLVEARKYFEQAVTLYPKYASAWFQLGALFEKENQKDSARDAFVRATAIDMKFLPPYLSLASMAFEEGDWPAVLQYTRHILDLDPFNYGDTNSYVLDFDELSPAQAYFYNAVANYQLNRIDEAEKSALKAERADLLNNFPQLHVLLAEIFTRKKNYDSAILELRSYLELVPHAKDADLVRERLAKLQQLNRSTAAEKPVSN
jgi:tetratricopeptide (TPR) repeat protein